MGGTTKRFFTSIEPILIGDNKAGKFIKTLLFRMNLYRYLIEP